MINLLQTPNQSFNDQLIIAAGSIIILVCVLVIVGVFWGYHKRKGPLLRIFGSTYFTFGIINPAGMLDWINKTTGDMKVYGKVILFYYKEGAYRVSEDRLFWINKIPHSIYKFGNPNAVNVLGIDDATIQVYDEDLKQNVTVKMSSQELKGALESKVVNELNKVGLNRMEMVTVIIMFVMIVLSALTLYESYSNSQSYGSLVNQLNQILSRFATTTTG